MSDGLDLRYYLFVAKRRFWHFLLPMLATLGLGFAVIFSLPKIYNASAKILVESPSINPVIFEAPTAAPAIEQLQALKTRILARENLLKIVDKFLLFKDRRDLSRTDIVDLMNERITFDTLEVNKNIKSQGNEKSAIVFSIGFDSEDPDAANKVANELMTLVMEEDASIRKTRATDTASFVNKEMDKISRSLADLDEKISAFKIANTGMLPEKLAYNLQNLDKQQQEMAAIDRDAVAGRSQKNLLEIEAKARQVDAANRQQVAPNGAPVTGLTVEAQLTQLKAEYAQAGLAPTHPTMRKLARQIEALQVQSDQNKVKFSELKPLDPNDPRLGVDLQLIIKKEQMIDEQLALNAKRRIELEKSVAQLQAIINRTPEIDAQLQNMQRAREALQENLNAQQVKLNIATGSVTAEENNVSEHFVVVEAPARPTEPVRPKLLQLFILATAAALGLGGATAFGTEYLDSTIRRSRDLKQKLNTRLIVTIPYVKTRSEVRRKRGTTSLYLLGFLAVLAGLLLLIHIFYQPLDILYYRISGKF